MATASPPARPKRPGGPAGRGSAHGMRGSRVERFLTDREMRLSWITMITRKAYRAGYRRLRRMMRSAVYSFAQMPLFMGVARLIDFRGALNDPPAPRRIVRILDASIEDMRIDWERVGNDLTEALREAELEAVGAGHGGRPS